LFVVFDICLYSSLILRLLTSTFTDGRERVSFGYLPIAPTFILLLT